MPIHAGEKGVLRQTQEKLTEYAASAYIFKPYVPVLPPISASCRETPSFEHENDIHKVSEERHTWCAAPQSGSRQVCIHPDVCGSAEQAHGIDAGVMP